MITHLVKKAGLASVLAMTLVLSLSVKAAEMESELSKVTLFVEGMMKSRGGVTWMSWPESVVAALSELPGIKSKEAVDMILDRDAFTVDYDETLTSLDDMYNAILGLGYTPSLSSGLEKGQPLTSGAVPEPIAAALLVAQAQNKPVFVDFYAQWCIACKALDEKTLSSEEVQLALEGYVVLKVDTDHYPDSGIFYDVVGMPTLILLDTNGEELYRSVGPISATELAEQLNKIGLK